MKKYANYIIVFLLIVSGYFIYNSFHLIKEVKILRKELKETNEGYDNNIQYAITLEDSITRFKAKIDSMLSADRFSIGGNLKSQAYLNQTMNIQKDWQDFLKNKLLQTNQKQKGDNPLVPFAGMAGVMRFDDAKVLNHRWMIAHFTDGTYQGEAIIRYDIDNKGRVRFKVLDQTLYK